MTPPLSYRPLSIAPAIMLIAAGLMPQMAAAENATAPAPPASAKASAKECINDLSGDFADDAGRYTFTMNFENTCDRPISCTIDATITSFRGPTTAHTVLRFPAGAQTPARKSYAIKVKAATGSAEYGRVCTFL